MTSKIYAGVAVAVAAAVTLVWALTGHGDFWPRWVWFGLATIPLIAYAFGRALRVPPGRRRWLAVDGAFCAVLLTVDLTVWVLSGGGYFWPAWTTLGATTLFGTHAWLVSRPPGRRERELAARVSTLTRSRSGALDRQAAELKRVERDLHDGAQARMVSLALALGLAGDLVRRDPPAAQKLIDEARQTAVAALDDLRSVMHSIHPPVLADRGLGDAVRALVLDLAVPVTVTGTPPAPLAPATETAAYFAVAECLSNVVKHSGASSATVDFAGRTDSLVITVRDDGLGGADPAAGSGLRGITDRLDAVDGRLEIVSPPGGPTWMTISVPL